MEVDSLHWLAIWPQSEGPQNSRQWWCIMVKFIYNFPTILGPQNQYVFVVSQSNHQQNAPGLGGNINFFLHHSRNQWLWVRSQHEAVRPSLFLSIICNKIKPGHTETPKPLISKTPHKKFSSWSVYFYLDVFQFCSAPATNSGAAGRKHLNCQPWCAVPRSHLPEPRGAQPAANLNRN